MTQTIKIFLSSLTIVFGSISLLSPVTAAAKVQDKVAPKLQPKAVPKIIKPVPKVKPKTPAKKAPPAAASRPSRGFQAWNRSLKKNVSPEFQKFREQKELEEEVRERALLAKLRQGEKVAALIDDNSTSFTSSTTSGGD